MPGTGKNASTLLIIMFLRAPWSLATFAKTPFLSFLFTFSCRLASQDTRAWESSQNLSSNYSKDVLSKCKLLTNLFAYGSKSCVLGSKKQAENRCACLQMQMKGRRHCVGTTRGDPRPYKSLPFVPQCFLILNDSMTAHHAGQFLVHESRHMGATGLLNPNC